MEEPRRPDAPRFPSLEELMASPDREKIERPDFTDEDLAIMDEVWRKIAEERRAKAGPAQSVDPEGGAFPGWT